MPRDLSPVSCECCEGISRRSFLKTSVAGAAAATVGSLPLLSGIKARAATPAASQPETLVATLYQSLSEAQRQAIAFPFDHPLRSKVDNNWNIVDKKLATFFTPDQQAMVREIFMGIHSPEYAERVMQQVEHDGEKEGFGVVRSRCSENQAVANSSSSYRAGM